MVCTSPPVSYTHLDVYKRQVEANATGQLVDDAALYTKKALKERNIPAYALTYVFGTPTIRNIKKDYYEIKSGNKKEVY